MTRAYKHQIIKINYVLLLTHVYKPQNLTAITLLPQRREYNFTRMYTCTELTVLEHL